MMARWELVPDGDNFLLLRDGQRGTLFVGPRDWAEEQLHRLREQEQQAREALATGDPLDLCRLGWHWGWIPVSVFPPSQYFRFSGKIGEAGGSLVYHIAEEPFEYMWRIVKCFGNLDPWFCSVCYLPVDDANRRLM